MYETKFVQKIAEIYERYKSEVTSGPTGWILKSFAGSVPTILHYIDEDPELRQKLGSMLRELSEAFEEDEESSK